MLVQKKTISTQVADAIRQKILMGEYAGNFQLRQEHLATEFGVSRIPVREALHQLHSEGFVTLVSHKGAVVTSISLDEILELYELRARIETWLLALAIPRMTEADLALARERAEQHQEQGRTGEYSNQLNWNFHATLYAPSGRKATIELVGRIYQQLERYTRMMVTLTEIQVQSDRDHWQLIELCEAKDTLRAVSLLEMHIITSGRFLVERLQELRGS
ncbi:GntR family transcriptional regulator [Mesorhizobium qingshengii]|uniref:DNA-binding transcriptional regulator, GntR family n=1 Tax=Mesorhizobium qingshengii TaxID=1165689 RepID=A0A1G5Z9D0_9HYPH|nr:GntR family transcriptional regulator [Mesorhizobium qingshengii]SDA91212.1 DNA-binding transcriptional regulator, GntR family [Mesorhizobium qingshengii]